MYYRVSAVNPEANTVTLIDTVGSDYTLPLDKYKQREVYQVQQLEICPGERMRFTKNIRTQDYKQLNGQWFTVEGLTDEGQITLKTNGKTQNVPLSQLLHSDYRYVDTVHSSQGQTADYCIYSASPAKSLTIGRESFYVAASRAKREFVVYTASAQDLGVTVQISRANENALDLVKSPQETAQKALLQEKPGAGESVLAQDTSSEKAASRQSPEATSLGQQRESLRQSEEAGQMGNRKELTEQSSPLPRGPSAPLHKNAPAQEKESQLTDAQLLTLLRSVEQWKKTCPKEPSREKGESSQKRIDDLNNQKARLEKKLRSQQQELQELGQPRSLLNPFGEKEISQFNLTETDKEIIHGYAKYLEEQQSLQRRLQVERGGFGLG